MIALDVAGRAQADEVVIALSALREQCEVVALLAPGSLAVVGDDVRLKPHDGRDTALRGLTVELHRAAHHSVIGEGHRALAQFLHPVEQSRDLARAVQNRVVRVDMEMREGSTAAHPPNVPAAADGVVSPAAFHPAVVTWRTPTAGVRHRRRSAQSQPLRGAASIVTCQTPTVRGRASLARWMTQVATPLARPKKSWRATGHRDAPDGL